MSSIKISRVIEGGIKEVKEIHELVDEPDNKYLLLGQSTGTNMQHCLLMAENHKQKFWHRVYGYKIIENDKMEKMLGEAMKKIKPKVESYMTVCFYERRADNIFTYVPRRLEIPDRPEFNNFPKNIGFITKTQPDTGAALYLTAEYAPEYSTFSKAGPEQKMIYYNDLGSERRCWIDIVYNTSDQSYVGTKYYNNKVVGETNAKGWNKFFTLFSAMGVGAHGG